MSSNIITSVPTNVITGFLGVGKTTCILHLLENKPVAERWAVLVNEFGEIGIDGSLFKGKYSQENGVFISEVPGGCMCCTAGLSMQIALNQLLLKAKPDRLLIEPTGLGHPVEVMDTLLAEHYAEVLDIQSVVTLVDARKISDPRYTTHRTFNQQIQVADIVIGNKQKLSDDDEKAKLVDYVNTINSKNLKIEFVDYGKLSLAQVAKRSSYASNVSTIDQSANEQPAHNHSSDTLIKHQDTLAKKNGLSEQEIPENGYIKAINSGEGFYSLGMRFSPDIEFSRKQLLNWMNGLLAERMKAVFITTEGIFGYNLSDGVLTEIELDDCFESRFEMISADNEFDNEEELLSCIQVGLR